MELLKYQYKRIATYFYIMLFLFLLLFLSNQFFRWDGLSLIIRSYIFILSLYVVFNFSRIDTVFHYRIYESKYGIFANYLLFTVTRLVPFVSIYLITIIFALIEYSMSDYWPELPLLELINGRYSNIIVYSLLFLLVLRIKKAPLITIPLFFFLSFFYLFILDKLVYSYMSSGAIISYIRIFKFISVVFFLILEYFQVKVSFVKSLAFSVIIGLMMYFISAGSLFVYQQYTKDDSHLKARAMYYLMRMGYSFPFNDYCSSLKDGRPGFSIITLIDFSRQYGISINYEQSEWERVLKSSSINSGNILCGYLNEKSIFIAYDSLISYVISRSRYAQLLKSEEIKAYLLNYRTIFLKDFMERFDSGNKNFRLFGIKVLAVSGEEAAASFLVSILSFEDTDISNAAYNALTAITGIDPLSENRWKVNSPETILFFIRNLREGTE